MPDKRDKRSFLSWLHSLWPHKVVDVHHAPKETNPPVLQILHTLVDDHNVTKIAWSPDGQLLASVTDAGYITFWDVQTEQRYRTLAPQCGLISNIAWSPDNQILAIKGRNSIQLWDSQKGICLQTFENTQELTCNLAWSPDGQFLASGTINGTICFWDHVSGKMSATPTSHIGSVLSVAWSPDGQLLAAGMENRTVQLWSRESHQLLKTLHGHTDAVHDVAWLPRGQSLVSCASDMTIRLWNSLSGRQLHVLEGHTSSVHALDVSPNGHLFVSMDRNGIAHLWRCDTLEMVATFESFTGSWPVGPIFHPTLPLLAGSGREHHTISIWRLDTDSLLATHPEISSVSYANAKVVIVGDTGVGKSGLSRALSEEPFVPTESTHGRSVRTLNHREVELSNGRKEVQEILLWDLAGQPGYRLIHQLELSGVAVALVVCDSRSETDPFAGVYHWVRSLQQAHLIQGGSVPPMKKFLVAARVDRGGIGVSSERIQALTYDLGFEGYFETSAKDGWHIQELRNAIFAAINWEALPKISSIELFQHIKNFLMAKKGAGRLLATIDDLYHAFLIFARATAEDEKLYAEFETSIVHMDTAGLVRRLSFGDLILLQPELLTFYAAALINAVRDDPDGLGSISEEQVRSGGFSIPKGERLQDREQERLLLIAMVEDLLRSEIVLRESSYLIFPSQSTREIPNIPYLEGGTVVFRFNGPLLNVYATLAVRLAQSDFFKKKNIWKNAITYTTGSNGICGIYLRSLEEGSGELTLFFDKDVSEEIRFHFEQYVQVHLQRRALPDTLVRRRIFTCEQCSTIVTDQQARARRSRGFNWVVCPVCDNHVSLLDSEERITKASPSFVRVIDQAADRQRERAATRSRVEGKIATNDFDVFLCHSSIDKPAVRRIGEQLKEYGILPWLDEWELRPGVPWQRLLEEQIKQIKSVAVFVGRSGIGPWQQQEISAFLREFVARKCPVIPILLPEAPELPQLPLFLTGMTWVDFRRDDRDPLEILIWGITGKRRSLEKNHIYDEEIFQALEPDPSVFSPLSQETTIIREAIKEDSEVRADISTIRIALGNTAYQQYEQLAQAIIRHMGASDAEMVTSLLVEYGTVWEILLPSLGLRLETGKAIFFLRQKEWNRSSYKDLLAIQRAKKADFLLVVDFLYIGIAPPRVSSSVVWLRPEMLEEMITTPREEIVAWLGRLIASQVEHFVELIRYRAGGTLDPETDLFVGRGYELQRFGGGKARGGILVGAHASGKSSLFAQLSERLKEQQYTVGGPYTVHSKDLQLFFQETLDELHLEVPANVDLKLWDLLLRRQGKKEKPFVLILDEVDRLLEADAENGWYVGSTMRALQNDGYCKFYLAGHNKLREAIEREGCPLRNFAEDIVLRGLKEEEEEAATELIRDPIKAVGFTVSEEQAKRICDGTARVPVLIQEFCRRLLLKIRRNRDVANVTDTMIEKVEEDLEYLSKVFEYYDYNQSWDKWLVTFIITQQGTASWEDIVQKFVAYGLELALERLYDILRYHERFGVLKQLEAGQYSVSSKYLCKAINARVRSGYLVKWLEQGKKEQRCYDED